MPGSLKTTTLLRVYLYERVLGTMEMSLVWLMPRCVATTALGQRVQSGDVPSDAMDHSGRRNYAFECVNWALLGMVARVLILNLNDSGRLVLCLTSLGMAFFALSRALDRVVSHLVNRKNDNLAHDLENKLLQKYITIATTLNQVLEDTTQHAIDRPQVLAMLRKAHLDCELAGLQCKRFASNLSKEATTISALPNIITSSTEQNSPTEQNSSTEQNSKKILPKALTFAILDDSALVRRNLERICLRHLQASPRSFCRGEDATECLSFIDEIIANKVDVAIVDENLDFEGHSLSGTSIAEMAQMRGYKGCLVRHSAQSASRIRVRPELFHGVIEKTSSREVFEENLGTAWSNHIRKHID